ncbi:MAG: 50S ribosomal protein L29 [Nanoarchaeota archaeon]
MKAREIRALSDALQSERIAEMEKELMKLNAQVATGTNPKSPGLIRKIKKTIARMRTIQHEKEIKL